MEQMATVVRGLAATVGACGHPHSTRRMVHREGAANAGHPAHDGARLYSCRPGESQKAARLAHVWADEGARTSCELLTRVAESTPSKKSRTKFRLRQKRLYACRGGTRHDRAHGLPGVKPVYLEPNQPGVLPRSARKVAVKGVDHSLAAILPSVAARFSTQHGSVRATMQAGTR